MTASGAVEEDKEMPKLEFVDAHVHFYDMQHPELFYAHWQPGVPHPTLGWQMQKLAERNYLACTLSLVKVLGDDLT